RVAFAPHLFADVPDNHRRRNNAMSRGYESRRSERFFRLWFFRIRILYLQESDRAKRQYYSHADKGHTYNFQGPDTPLLKPILSPEFLRERCRRHVHRCQLLSLV